ncbi:MAG: hydantoinase B/oxoprolinase family protein [Anaerolineales bacterium]
MRSVDSATSSAMDPYSLEILKSKLLAISEEMSVVLARTSMSPIVYEVLDFACGLTDPEGQVIAQANGLTLFTGTFATQVQSVIDKFGRAAIKPGDIFMTNGPYDGGTHTCDIALIQPIYVDSELVGFGVSITHWTEVGGKTPGSVSPDATEIYQEGLQFPIIHIVQQGQIVEEVVDIIRANVRLPLMSLGDLNAGIAACRIAERRLLEMCRRYGLESVRHAYSAILEHGERLARSAIQRIPDGVYEAEDFIDGDGISDDLIPIRVEITVADDEMTVDFTGCAPQRPGPINCTYGALLSACKTVFKAITDPQAPSNEGWFRPFKIIIPEATVFSAVRPAPTGWYYEASAYATELVWKSLAAVLPERLTAGSYLSLCATYLGGVLDESGEVWVHPEPHNGGWGAGRGMDGQNGLIATTDGDTNNYPVELLESKFPLLVERYSLNDEDGGGGGQWRGGLGLIREYRLLDSTAFLHASLGRNSVRPWGLAGGQPGSNNYVEVHRDGEVMRCARIAYYPLQRGDVIRILTGRGGGYGDARSRPLGLVIADVRNGYLSHEQARSDYEVVLREDFSIDQAATDALGASRRAR